MIGRLASVLIVSIGRLKQKMISISEISQKLKLLAPTSESHQTFIDGHDTAGRDKIATIEHQQIQKLLRFASTVLAIFFRIADSIVHPQVSGNRLVSEIKASMNLECRQEKY